MFEITPTLIIRYKLREILKNMERGRPNELEQVKRRGSKKGVPKPVKWDERLINMAFQFALLGATDKELAVAFDVAIDTISQWKRKHPQFREGYAKGKASADARVAYSLFQNAIGFYYDEETVVRGVDGPGTYKIVKVQKYHCPESWAQVRWLDLRRGGDWSATQKYEVKNTNTNIHVDVAKLSTAQLEALKALSNSNILTIHE